MSGSAKMVGDCFAASLLRVTKLSCLLALAAAGALCGPPQHGYAQAEERLITYEQFRRCYGDEVRLLLTGRETNKRVEIRVPTNYLSTPGGPQTPDLPQPWPQCPAEPVPVKALAIDFDQRESNLPKTQLDVSNTTLSAFPRDSIVEFGMWSGIRSPYYAGNIGNDNPLVGDWSSQWVRQNIAEQQKQDNVIIFPEGIRRVKTWLDETGQPATGERANGVGALNTYLAPDDLTEPLSGKPLVFLCNNARYGNQPHKCTVYYRLSEELTYFYTFIQEGLPYQRWRELDNAMREFAAQTVVDSTIKQEILAGVRR